MNKCFECANHGYQKTGELKAICTNEKVVLQFGQAEPGHLFIFRSGSCHPLLENCFEARTQATTTPRGRRG